MLHCQMIGARRKGRPRKRWLQDAEEDMNILHFRNWKDKGKQKDVWRRIAKEAKDRRGL
jgi:hypothetical protein